MIPLTKRRTDAFGFFSNPTETNNDDEDAASTGGGDTPRKSNSVAPVGSASVIAPKKVVPSKAKDPTKPKRIRRSLAQIEEDERNGIKRKKTYPKKKKVVEPVPPF